MRKFFAVAMGSLVALLGFAGTANASATVDLIWIDISTLDSAGNVICLRPAKRNCPQFGTSIGGAGTGTSNPASSILISSDITLGVLLTAGPGGVVGVGTSVDYNDALMTVADIPVDFQRLTTTRPLNYLPSSLGDPYGPDSVDPAGATGWVQLINAAASPGVGIGLLPSATAYLGTVTFHKDFQINGTFEIAVGNGPGGADDVLRLSDNAVITATTTFNSAWLLNVPEPGALSLLVMGVGGMLLAGRGRRS
jgi:hypothetical protein